MFRSSHVPGAPASAPSIHSSILPARESFRRVPKTIFIGATAALFAYWLASPNGQRPMGSGYAPASNCESVGRGGTLCKSASHDDRVMVKNPEPAPQCQSLGRGGLLCAETTKK